MCTQLTIDDIQVESSTFVEEPSTYVEPQGDRLFWIEPTSRAEVHELSSPEVGDIGEQLVVIHAKADGLEVVVYLHGTRGKDLRISGRRIQVKATWKIQKDGYMRFSAGHNKRFTDYAGEADYFAFIFVDINSDWYDRMLMLSYDEVVRHWPGSQVALRPTELLKRPDFSMLKIDEQAVSDQPVAVVSADTAFSSAQW